MSPFLKNFLIFITIMFVVAVLYSLIPNLGIYGKTMTWIVWLASAAGATYSFTELQSDKLSETDEESTEFFMWLCTGICVAVTFGGANALNFII